MKALKIRWAQCYVLDWILFFWGGKGLQLSFKMISNTKYCVFIVWSSKKLKKNPKQGDDCRKQEIPGKDGCMNASILLIKIFTWGLN